MYDKNIAYDLSLFDEQLQKKNVVKLNTKKLREKRVLKAKLALLISGISVCTGVSLIAAVFIRGQASLNELTAQESRLSRELQEAESLYIQLSMKKEAEISNEALRARLKENFGMTDNKNTEYINISNTVNNGDSEEGLSGVSYIKNRFSKLWNNLFSF